MKINKTPDLFFYFFKKTPKELTQSALSSKLQKFPDFSIEKLIKKH